MTDPGVATVYRYVSDGQTAAPTPATAGMAGSVLGRVMNRRRMRRLYPSGSVTEARLEPDALVLTRQATTRTIPYSRIRQIRAREHAQHLVVRGRPTVEVLPPHFLPPEALETIRARASGAVPLSSAPPPTGPTRQITVPDGWATHVAVLTLRETVSTPRFWARLGLSLVVSALMASAAGVAWLALGPGLALLALAVAHVRTRRAIAAALPSGSLASVEVLDDRLVSRTSRWAREIRFDEVRAVEIRSDVVFLTMASIPPLLVLARDLVPDEVLDRLPAKRAGSA
jgi:hypothetical protein